MMSGSLPKFLKANQANKIAKAAGIQKGVPAASSATTEQAQTPGTEQARQPFFPRRQVCRRYSVGRRAAHTRPYLAQVAQLAQSLGALARDYKTPDRPSAPRPALAVRTNSDVQRRRHAAHVNGRYQL